VLLLLPGAAGAQASDAKLERLRARIAELQQTLNRTAERRDEAREALHDEERRIAALTRSLHELDQRLSRDARALGELEHRAGQERERRRAHLDALAHQARAAYALGRQPYLKLLLNQENPATVARVLAYYRYFNRARAAGIERARAALGQLDALAAEIRSRRRALAELRAAHDRERAALEASRARRARLLASLERELAGQTRELERLRADETRLERLVRELKAMLPQALDGFGGRHAPFAALKGRLPLPLEGRLQARFGEPKGIGDLSWRGIFLAAPAGTEVRAVAHGRVAFADWLRGFGLLLIMDHGDGYMTLYGHNEALYRQVGDWVEAGQPIAVAGSTGDAPGNGVYFEIRYQGVPHDPLQWCAVGRTSPARARR
jgi:septal ring factor EnvC (AmiA/AmiB activator)